jgi:membrane-associated phospholipid phosphatase
LTLLITDILKFSIRYPRPNYFSYCQYNLTLNACAGKTNHQKDSTLSFPSGHSSISFASSVWIYLFLSYCLKEKEEIWWILLKILPLAISSLIALTRIIDYMHHVSDVLGGTLIGLSVAIIVYSSQEKRIFLLSNSASNNLIFQL